MPFGLFIGISPTGSPIMAYTNLTSKEIIPTWTAAELSVSIPVNQYTDMIIISSIPLEVSGY